MTTSGALHLPIDGLARHRVQPRTDERKVTIGQSDARQRPGGPRPGSLGVTGRVILSGSMWGDAEWATRMT